MPVTSCSRILPGYKCESNVIRLMLLNSKRVYAGRIVCFYHDLWTLCVHDTDFFYFLRCVDLSFASKLCRGQRRRIITLLRLIFLESCIDVIERQSEISRKWKLRLAHKALNCTHKLLRLD